jgi:hypothetical protein
MSKSPNKAAVAKATMTWLFQVECYWRGVGQPRRPALSI